MCTLDRPEARNAMTPAMYFGIRYAIRHVDADPDLAGLLITGTGDVFAPGGDMGGGGGSDNWLTFGSALGMDVTPFETLRQSVKPVVSAVNGLCQGGGLQIALCSDMAVVSDRATFRVPELLRGIADTYYSQMLARLIGPVRTRDLMFTGRTLSAAEAQEWGMVARVVPHDELLDAARDVLAQCCRTAPARAARGEVQPGQLPRPLRPHRHAGELRLAGGARGVPRVQGAAITRLGASRPADRRPPLPNSSAFSEYRICCTVLRMQTVTHSDALVAVRLRVVRSHARRDPADAARGARLSLRPRREDRGDAGRSCPTTWPAFAAADW